MAPRSSHSAVVFGSGSGFRLVVLFGGRGAFRGKLLSKTTLLTLGELLYSSIATCIPILSVIQTTCKPLGTHVLQYLVFVCVSICYYISNS